MAEQLKFETSFCTSTEELRNVNMLRDDATQLITEAEGLTAEQAWANRHSIVKAGIGAEHVIAIAGRVMCDKEIDVTPADIAKYTFDFLAGQFKADNVLSLIYGEQNTKYCKFLVYPLNIRQLNPDPWGNPRKMGSLKKEIIQSFYFRFEQKFNVQLEYERDDDNGHTEYLDKFPKQSTGREDIEEVMYDTLEDDTQEQMDAPKDKIEDITSTLIKAFTTGTNQGDFIKCRSHGITRDEYRANARSYLKRNYPELSERDIKLLIKRLDKAAFGFYKLDPLINDQKISDIKVVNHKKIRVKVEGKRRTSNLRFIDEDDYYNFLNTVMLNHNITPGKLDERGYPRAIYVFTDIRTNPGYILRNNITTDVINSGEPVYHIRKVPKTKYTIDDLINLKVMDEATANYLLWAARYAKGMVFTGKGSSGKTTMMNTLLEYTPSNASGLVIQESEELFSAKPEMTFQHIVPGYDLKELSRNGLLTDIDYFIIGEVKGDEAMYFINACDTGNKGWCSVHSPNSTDAIDKLADYVMYASKYDKNQAMKMLKELQVVVFMKNFKVAEISEIIGWDEDKKRLKYRLVFRKKELVED